MEQKDNTSYKQEMTWGYVLWYLHLHVLGLYGFWLLLTEAKMLTIIFVIFVTFIAGLGVTVGAHRLWAHETFVACWQVRLFLMLAHTLAGVGPIYDWVLAHKLHHHYYGTDKDPYNHRKGFLYSHVLSNLMSARTDLDTIKKSIDMRTIESDNFIFIQRRLYWVLFIILGILVPINIPAEYWGESLIVSLFVLGFLRLVITLNVSWLVNSGLLIWGLTPGEKYPSGDNSSFFIRKSYWLPYHYICPWDWKSGEFGSYNSGVNTLCLKIWYDLGLINYMSTITSENVRDALYNLTKKNASLKSYRSELKEMADFEARRKKLECHH